MQRRSFIKYVSGTGFFCFTYGAGGIRRAFADPLPGGTLDPGVLPKYTTAMLIPPVMPRAGKLKVQGGPAIDYYEIGVRQFSQQILPTGFPKTTVWGYGPSSTPPGPAIFNSPALTIEATWGQPVRVKWINELVDANGDFLPHLLPVDPTLHWANPPGGEDLRDTRPDFSATPGPYTGPVPLVTHVHGAAGVGDESDGYTEAWYLPAAGNIPAGHADVGTWYGFFKAKAEKKFGVQWSPGSATCQYLNVERAGTKWYHDHALGMTRNNVYAGLAGFYLLRGGPGDVVLDSRNGKQAVLPGPAPSPLEKPGTTHFELPIAIQDRSFNVDGSLFYPDTRVFFDGITGPYIPDTESDVSPIWNPEVFGNTIMVNGNTWPFQVVKQRRYRLRFLNGCQSRFLILDFSAITNVKVHQIGNEGGFLAAPVEITTANQARWVLGPGERADCIVDFTAVSAGKYVLRNIGPDEPFRDPGEDFLVADPDSTGQVLEFRVVATKGSDLTTPAEFLQLPAVPAMQPATVTRRLVLFEMLSEFFDDTPVAALLGVVEGDPAKYSKREWGDPVTENPALGATEIWEIYNATGDAHPMHIHEVLFEVVNRQAIFVDESNQTVTLEPGSQPTPPEPWETGVKDTVIAYPDQVTRVKMTFDTAGQYVWHCHILEHEDNEMMRPLRVGPSQPGEPVKPLLPG